MEGPEENLTQKEAQSRAVHFSNIHYKLNIKLEKKSKTFEGHLSVHFAFKKSPSGGEFVFFDAVCKEVHTLIVNGTNAPIEGEFRNNRIYVNPEKLVDGGENLIQIKFSNFYTNTGDGFHHFLDPEDDQEYLYTNFEPFYCHRWFPCFDQPDLKGFFSLVVEAPSDWVAVSNSKVLGNVVKVNDAIHRTEFETTPLLSTYLYALIIGPYSKFDDKYEDIPLSAYCRKSLAKYFDPEEFFTITKQGLKFYIDFFDYKYPFTKYDQVFACEFNLGAMENPGVITFSERYIFRDPPTDGKRLNRAEVILHEMAHMWFGDLVTMKWWDGLWLNESFATYMSYLALDQSTRFGSRSWVDFHQLKRWAYNEDQLSTTHPIQGIVPDAISTFLNFDGITYAKGASVLKQLVAVVGLEGFRDGVRTYFKRHEWGNTVINDFITAIQEGSKRDLQNWSKIWLETAELNTLTPKIVEKDGKTGLVIEQTAPEKYPTIRPHHIDIAAYELINEKVVLTQTLPVEISEVHNFIPINLKKGAIYVNHNDEAYAKVALDEDSLDFVFKYLERFEDPLTRILLWSSLVNMVRDAHLSSVEFLKIVSDKIGSEKNFDLMSWIVSSAMRIADVYLPSELRVEEFRKMFSLSIQSLQRTEDSDEQITWAKAAIAFISSPVEVEKMLKIYKEGIKVKGDKTFQLDQDMRWDVVIHAASYNLNDWEHLLKEEEARDGSDRAQRKVRVARASPPFAEVKENTWNEIFNNAALSRYFMISSMTGFVWWHQYQEGLLAKYEDLFFENIVQVSKTRSIEVTEPFVLHLFPYYSTNLERVLTRAQSLVDTLSDEKEAAIKRLLKESVDDVIRRLKCQARARSYVEKKK